MKEHEPVIWEGKNSYEKETQTGYHPIQADQRGGRVDINYFEKVVKGHRYVCQFKGTHEIVQVRGGLVDTNNG